MTVKRPDLDARGHPINPAASFSELMPRGGMVYSQIHINVHQDIHNQFLAYADKLEITPKQIVTELYYEACSEMGIDTDGYTRAGSANWRRKHGIVYIPLSDVVMDECDLPGQCENIEIGELDPYYSTFVSRDLDPERRSLQAAKLEHAINNAGKAIERLTSMKAYTSVFNEGRISKEEATRELREVLDLFPEEIGTTLWGWCSLNDAIQLVTRWKRAVVNRMQQQMEIEQLRITAKSRADFGERVDRRLIKSKERMLGTYIRQKEIRPKPKDGEWPSWAGEMESYLDLASSNSMQRNKDTMYEIKARDIFLTDTGSINEVQTDCAVDISKGLDND